MKKLICTSLLALAVSTANAAMYKPGAYFRGDVGVNMFDNKTLKQTVGKSQFTGGIGAGYKFNPMFRADLNVHYKQISKSGVKAKFYEPYLNLYFDIETTSIFTPYITAGAGATILDLRVLNLKKTYNYISWNLGLGSRAQLSKDVDLDLGYKFTGLADTKSGDAFKNANAHKVTIGLIWNL